MYLNEYNSPIGILYIIADDKYVKKIILPNGIEKIKKASFILEENGIIKKTKEWLDMYFIEKKQIPLPPLLLEGTIFQKKVWHVVSKIPYGQVLTYKQVGDKVGCKYYQAIGQAMKRNPIPILIPCHRVIGSNHTLTGYGGGLSTKEKLLEMENVKLS